MSTEEGGKPLQDLLSELLRSEAERRGQEAPGEEEADALVAGEEKPYQQPVAAAGVIGEGAAASGLVQEPLVALAEGRGKPEPQPAEPAKGAQGVPPAVGQIPLQGKVEVRVVTPINMARLSQLERELRERDDIAWLGTWGTAKEGMRLHLQLERPLPLPQLFPSQDLVEKVEVVKGGKTWLLAVTLAGEPGPPPAREEGLAASGEPLPIEPGLPPLGQEGPPATPEPPYPGVTAHKRGRMDLEVSPIHSLEDLSRFEQLLASLGVRTTNVLSLDGVSTVLFSLEGLDRTTLAQRLQEKLPGIGLEMGPDRVKARLPSP